MPSYLIGPFIDFGIVWHFKLSQVFVLWRMFSIIFKVMISNAPSGNEQNNNENTLTQPENGMVQLDVIDKDQSAACEPMCYVDTVRLLPSKMRTIAHVYLSRLLVFYCVAIHHKVLTDIRRSTHNFWVSSVENEHSLRTDGRTDDLEMEMK